MKIFRKKDERTVEKIVADAMNERGKIIKIAGKKFKMLPTTLSQITDISAIISTMGDISVPENIDKNVDAYYQVFKHGITARCKAEIATVLLFRNEDVREEYYDFIIQNLTQAEFRPIYDFMLECIDPSFFLISIITLAGMNQLAPTKTTPHS